ITSKILGLIKEGHNVRVFLGRASNDKAPFSYVNPFPMNKHFMFITLPFVLLFLFTTRTRVTYRFWVLERKQGRSWFDVLKRLYVNAHILKYSGLDWLHFTFSTFAI